MNYLLEAFPVPVSQMEFALKNPTHLYDEVRGRVEDEYILMENYRRAEPLLKSKIRHYLLEYLIKIYGDFPQGNKYYLPTARKFEDPHICDVYTPLHLEFCRRHSRTINVPHKFITALNVPYVSVLEFSCGREISNTYSCRLLQSGKILIDGVIHSTLMQTESFVDSLKDVLPIALLSDSGGHFRQVGILTTPTPHNSQGISPESEEIYEDVPEIEYSQSKFARKQSRKQKTRERYNENVKRINEQVRNTKKKRKKLKKLARRYGMIPESSENFEQLSEGALQKVFNAFIKACTDIWNYAKQWTGETCSFVLEKVIGLFKLTPFYSVAVRIYGFVLKYIPDVKFEEMGIFFRQLSTDWRHARNNPYALCFVRLILLLFLLISCPGVYMLCSQEKFDILMSEFKRLWNKQDIVTIFVDGTHYFLNGIKTFFKQGSVDGFIFTRSMCNEMDVEFLWIRRMYLSYVPGNLFINENVTEHEFNCRLDSLIKMVEEKLRVAPKVAAKELKIMLLDLNKIKVDIANRMLGQKNKITPYTWLITGTTKSNKTGFNHGLVSYVSQANKIPHGPQYKYSLNAVEKNFYSGFHSHITSITLDDMGNMKSEATQVNMIEFFLRFSQNESQNMPQGELSLKGVVYNRALIGGCTSNKIDGGAGEYTEVVSALMRRYSLLVTVQVKPEFCQRDASGKPTSLIDFDRVPTHMRTLPLPPVWLVTVCKIEVSPQAPPRKRNFGDAIPKYQDAAWRAAPVIATIDGEEIEMEDVEVDTFLKYVRLDSTKHFRREKVILESHNNLYKDFICSECIMPHHYCMCFDEDFVQPENSKCESIVSPEPIRKLARQWTINRIISFQRAWRKYYKHYVQPPVDDEKLKSFLAQRKLHYKARKDLYDVRYASKPSKVKNFKVSKKEMKQRLDDGVHDEPITKEEQEFLDFEAKTALFYEPGSIGKSVGFEDDSSDIFDQHINLDENTVEPESYVSNVKTYLTFPYHKLPYGKKRKDDPLFDAINTTAEYLNQTYEYLDSFIPRNVLRFLKLLLSYLKKVITDFWNDTDGQMAKTIPSYMLKSPLGPLLCASTNKYRMNLILNSFVLFSNTFSISRILFGKSLPRWTSPEMNMRNIEKMHEERGDLGKLLSTPIMALVRSVNLFSQWYSSKGRWKTLQEQTAHDMCSDILERQRVLDSTNSVGATFREHVLPVATAVALASITIPNICEEMKRLYIPQASYGMASPYGNYNKHAAPLTQPQSEMRNVIHNSIIKAQGFFRENLRTKSTRVHMLALGNSLFVAPTHFVIKLLGSTINCERFGKRNTGVPVKFSMLVDKTNTYSIPGTDFTFIKSTYTPDFKAIHKLVPLTSDKVLDVRTLGIFSLNESGKLEMEVLRNARRKDVNNGASHLHPDETFPGWEYEWDSHRDGQCMSVLFDAEAKTTSILGVHLGACHYNSYAVGGILTHEHIAEACDALKVHAMVEPLPVVSDLIALGDKHPKSSANMEGINYLGTINIRSSPTTSVEQARMGKYVYDVTNIKHRWLPSAMHGPDNNDRDYWRRLTMSKSTTQMTEIRPEILKAARDSYTEKLREIDYNVKILTEEELVTGNGDYLTPISMSTSAGIFTGGKKSSHATLYQNKWYVDEDIWTEFRKADECIRSGHRVNMVFTGCPKDEPLAEAKVKDGKVRAFFSSEFVPLLLIRKYFGGPLSAIISDHKKSECAVGINPLGADWTEMMEHLESNDKRNGFISLDYKNYDMSLSTQIISEMMDILIELHNDEELSQADRNAMAVLKQEIVWSFINFNGDLVEFIGHLLSGIPMTSIGGAMIGSLLLRVYWIECGYDIKKFNKQVCAYMYGDDNISTSKAKGFNTITIMKAAAKFGITLTNAKKNANIKKFENKKDITFLKRSFVPTKVEGKNYYLAPLAEPSFWKPLCVRNTNTDISTEAYYAQVLDRCKLEAVQYEPDVGKDLLLKLGVIKEQYISNHDADGVIEQLMTFNEYNFEELRALWEDKL